MESAEPKLVGSLRAEIEQEAAEQVHSNHMSRFSVGIALKIAQKPDRCGCVQVAACQKIQAVRRGQATRRELEGSRSPEEARQLRDVRGDVASPEEAKEAFELAAKQLKVTREPGSLCASALWLCK